MNREEAIEMWVIPALKNTWNDKRCKEILEALEQEPCEDCISRQYLIEKAVSWDKHFADGIRYVALTDILNAPPVTSAEKVGHWEYVQYDGNPNIGNWHCSECRAIVNYEQIYNWEKKPHHKFCPNCGAKMQEVESYGL